MTSRIVAGLAPLAGGWLLAGCMVHQPETSVSPMVSDPASYEQSFVEPASEMPANWWGAFEDATLDALVREALESNLELRELVARIEQAEALLRQAGGRLLPQLDAAADLEARWDELDHDPVREESSSLAGLLSWEMDLWGRLRSQRAAQAWETDVARHDLEGGRLLLSVAVAETYFEILEQRLQRDLIRQQIQVNQTLLDLTRLRFGQAQSSIVDVFQQQEQLESTKAIMPEVEARLEQLEYSMDVLLGRLPGQRSRTRKAMLQPPPPLAPTGVPSDLLRHRPDLRAAHDRVVAVDYRVGAAIADRLPRFVIGGSLAATGDAGLNSLVGTLFASAIAPVYDAGIRKAEVARRRARLEELVARFSHAYLEAVRQVETALLLERKQDEQVALLRDQLQTAQRLLTETRNRYSQGLTDYLPVLEAVTRAQVLERNLLSSRRQLLSFRVGVYRALGGPLQPATRTGWEEAAR